jgi:hypothetical protein
MNASIDRGMILKASSRWSQRATAGENLGDALRASVPKTPG